jgi:hypothetical protein
MATRPRSMARPRSPCIDGHASMARPRWPPGLDRWPDLDGQTSIAMPRWPDLDRQASIYRPRSPCLDRHASIAKPRSPCLDRQASIAMGGGKIFVFENGCVTRSIDY